MIKVETVYKILPVENKKSLKKKKNQTQWQYLCACTLFFFFLIMCINYKYSSLGLCDTGDIQEKQYITRTNNGCSDKCSVALSPVIKITKRDLDTGYGALSVTELNQRKRFRPSSL